METSRVVRAEFLSVNSRPFADAARGTGVRDVDVILRHLVPNVAPTILVAGTLAVGRGISTRRPL